MKEVGAFEAKNRLGALLDLVEEGEEIVITRHGRKVAKLVPTEPRTDRQQARAALGRLRARAQGLGLGQFGWEEFKTDRDRGRP